jgi:hypothetical protein
LEITPQALPKTLSGRNKPRTFVILSAPLRRIKRKLELAVCPDEGSRGKSWSFSEGLRAKAGALRRFKGQKLELSLTTSGKLFSRLLGLSI